MEAYGTAKVAVSEQGPPLICDWVTEWQEWHQSVLSEPRSICFSVGILGDGQE